MNEALGVLAIGEIGAYVWTGASAAADSWTDEGGPAIAVPWLVENESTDTWIEEGQLP